LLAELWSYCQNCMLSEHKFGILSYLIGGLEV